MFFSALFLLGDLAKKRICEQEQARESRQCAIKLAQRGHSRCAAKLQRLGRPILKSADGGAVKEQARVRRAGNHHVLRGIVFLRSNKIGGVGAHGFWLKGATDDHEALRHGAGVGIEKHFRANAVGGAHRRG